MNRMTKFWGWLDDTFSMLAVAMAFTAGGLSWIAGPWDVFAALATACVGISVIAHVSKKPPSKAAK